jgi:hypothetical protein
MGRHSSGRLTCEDCNSIDVRRWHRERRLTAGQYFSWGWTRDGEPSGSISVRSESNAVVLIYRWRSYGETERNAIEQRVPIAWTPCHFGGSRPWFRCSVYSGGRYCGRRAAKLYGAGKLFACRRCYRLAYASQHEAARDRGLVRAQKIRIRLGGSPGMLHDFPEKPKGMHWRTYDRLRRAHDIAESQSTLGLMQFVASLDRRARRRS